MTKQTAVEWLFDHLVLHLDWSKVEDRELFRKLKAEAKEMEKQQIIDAHQDGHSVTYNNYWAELYYNETYGGKNEN
jgi:hypothetical protein